MNKDHGFVCYKNESRIPPLDFNTSCITYGRYVIFYNERVVGKIYPSGYETSNVITELCEVTVKGMDIFFISDCFNTTCNFTFDNAEQIYIIGDKYSVLTNDRHVISVV